MIAKDKRLAPIANKDPDIMRQYDFVHDLSPIFCLSPDDWRGRSWVP
jgi:hypothetical protein